MTSFLTTVGEALYGPRWQTDLSRDIGVSDRSMRRWAAGTDAVPSGVWHDVSRLLENRVADLERLNYRLSGLTGVRTMTLQPIANSSAEYSIEGIHFAMTTPDGAIVRCMACREIFSELCPVDTAGAAAEYFRAHASAFHVAASVKYDLGEIDRGRVLLGLTDLQVLQLPDMRSGRPNAPRPRRRVETLEPHRHIARVETEAAEMTDGSMGFVHTVFANLRTDKSHPHHDRIAFAELLDHVLAWQAEYPNRHVIIKDNI